MPSPNSDLLTTIADLWIKSTIIQGLMALMGFTAVCYLAITGRPIPDLLSALISAIVGYYFGTKTTQTGG